MALLHEYIKAVRTYLPTGREADDVADELTELLQSKIDDREEQLGRPLSEKEQEGLLAEFGNPLVIASRYGRVNHGLSFGRQLIGPELFPVYLRALAIPLVIDLLSVPFLIFSKRAVFTNPLQIIIPLFYEVLLVTVIFIGIHTARTWLPTRSSTEARNAWLFPGAYLRPTPRWLTAAGLVVLALISLWWVAVPHIPALAMGAASAVLQLGPAWSRFYWPILALLAAGVAHRAVSFVRPDWNWLRPTALLAINTFAVVLLYPILRAEPFFEASVMANTHAEALARTLNNYVWWYLVGFGTYWLINVFINARLCSRLIRSHLLRDAR